MNAIPFPVRSATPLEIGLQRAATVRNVPPLQPSTQNVLATEPRFAEVSLIRGDTVNPKPIRWLWNGYLAAGKFHVLAGQPGTGKTTIALDFAAIVSSGGLWPDG